MTDYIGDEGQQRADVRQDPCHPFGKLFDELEAYGLKLRRTHGSPVQKMRYSSGLYSVEINHGKGMAEYIHITKPIAKVVAKFFTDPKLGDIDIPFANAIDEDAKPILEEAIQRYKGLGALVGNRTLSHADANSKVFDWFNQVLVKSSNPNLVGVSNRSANLAPKAAENQKYADSIIEAMNDPKLIDKDVCDLAAERMPLILFTVSQRNEKKSAYDKHDDANGLLRLQAVAQGYGIKLEVPEELLKPSKVLADKSDIAHRSWTTLPTVELKGTIKKKIPAQVLKNDGDRFYNNTPLDIFRGEKDRRESNLVGSASRSGEYPPPRQR